jgi:hypothetical protein
VPCIRAHTPFSAMWHDSAAYGASSAQDNLHGRGNPPNVPLQFYDQSSFYLGSRSSLEGNVASQGSIVPTGTAGYTGSIQPSGGWWTAFGTGGFEGEPPLLEGACAVIGLVLLCVPSHHNLHLPLPTLRTRHQLLSHRSQVHDCS